MASNEHSCAKCANMVTSGRVMMCHNTKLLALTEGGASGPGFEYVRCTEVRLFKVACGAEAKWFEPKK